MINRHQPTQPTLHSTSKKVQKLLGFGPNVDGSYASFVPGVPLKDSSSGSGGGGSGSAYEGEVQAEPDPDPHSASKSVSKPFKMNTNSSAGSRGSFGSTI